MKLVAVGAICVGVIAIPAGVVLGFAINPSNSAQAGQAPLDVVSPPAISTPTPVATPTTPQSTLKSVTVSAPRASGQTLGVGAIVDLRFSRSLTPAQQTEVEGKLDLASSPAVTGAWHWVRDNEVHFRPKSPWTPGTAIFVKADLATPTNPNAQPLNWSATIGRSRVSVADLQSHQMVITDTDLNGVTTSKTIPFSGGAPRHPTRNGTFITMSREAHIVMDSATVGIPRDSPDGYLINARDAVRITESGTFVHGAPWSVASQGRANVSHGCLNVSAANALWFRQTTLLGDLVKVKGSTDSFNPDDRGSADWSPTWAQVLAESRTGEHLTA